MTALIDNAPQRRVALALAMAIMLHGLALLLWHTAAGRIAVPLPFRFAAHLRPAPAPSAVPASLSPRKPASPPQQRASSPITQTRVVRGEARSPVSSPATTEAPPAASKPGTASPAGSEPSGQTLVTRAKDIAIALDKENERPHEAKAEARKPLEQAIARLFKSGSGTSKVEQLQNGTIRLTHADGSQTCYLLPPAYLGMLSALPIPIAPMNCP